MSKYTLNYEKRSQRAPSNRSGESVKARPTCGPREKATPQLFKQHQSSSQHTILKTIPKTFFPLEFLFVCLFCDRVSRHLKS